MTRIFRRKVYERISIKTFELQDSEPLFGRIEECRPHLRRWLPWVDSVQSAADTKIFIERGLEQAAREDGFHAAMLEDGLILGAIGLHHIDQMHRNASIGYWIGERFVGRGIVTRCCRALVEHLFIDLNLHRVEIRAAVENRRSRAIPERLGFREEGLTRDGEWLYDHYVDLVVYSLLEEEWSG